MEEPAGWSPEQLSSCKLAIRGREIHNDFPNGGELISFFFEEADRRSISDIPVELLLIILDAAILKPKDAISIGLVCKAFQELVLDNNMWQRLFQGHWPQQNPNLKMRSWFKFFKLRAEAVLQHDQHKAAALTLGCAHPIENCEQEMECPLIWENLGGKYSMAPTGDFAMERVCSACSKDVRFVTNQRSLEKNMSQGHPVCIDFTFISCYRPSRSHRRSWLVRRNSKLLIALQEQWANIILTGIKQGRRWKDHPQVGRPGRLPRRSSVQANGSFRAGTGGVSFFEVTISSLASGTTIAVGFTTRCDCFPSNGALPGWLPGTHGFHSDDWSYFGGAGQPRASYPQAKRIQAGDTIGCGLTNGGELFFTVNTTLVARALQLDENTVCTPIIGVDGPGVSLVANFGQQAFRFDVNCMFDSETSYKTVPTGWSAPQEAMDSTLKIKGKSLDNMSTKDCELEIISFYSLFLSHSLRLAFSFLENKALLLNECRGDQQAVQGNAAFWILHNMVCFYEVTILRLPPKALVAVGLTTKRTFPAKGALPGWLAGTYGFHSDDWCYFAGSAESESQLALAASGRRDVMRAGDTLGCGITNRGELFFTLNYDLVAVVERDMDRALPYVPVVGVCGKVELQTNFGSEGFVFDVGGMFRTAANCPDIYSPGQSTHLTDIPAEVLLRIFDGAISTPKEAVSIGLVCKAFQGLVVDNSIWQRLFLQRWPQQNPNLKMRSWFKFFMLREEALKQYGHRETLYASGGAHPIENCDWEFQCPLVWEQLKPDYSVPRDSFDMEVKRLCGACKEHVHYVTNQSELEEHVGQGHCVCIDFTQRKHPEPRRKMGKMVAVRRGPTLR
ncbi:C2H2-type domain-containing protein [Balamuthia mandrillaris]